MAVSAVTNSSAENAQRACYLPIPPKKKQKMSDRLYGLQDDKSKLPD